MVGMIYAVSPEGVIGIGNRVPWSHPGDFRRFKRVTLGTTVVMGRKTFESMGKPLPERRNVVVTRAADLGVPGVECVKTLGEGIALAGSSVVWLVGGRRIYEEGMQVADVIDVTYVPDHVDAPDAVRAPPIDERIFEPGPLLPHEDEPGLSRRVYTRRSDLHPGRSE
jgi:dihydrofolate reductase